MACKMENGGLLIESTGVWKSLQPSQTKFLECKDCGILTVVREDYYGFKGSNVYAVDENLNIAWYAELPNPSDAFANPLVDEGTHFSTVTWNGIRCLIDKVSGKTIVKGVTK